MIVVILMVLIVIAVFAPQWWAQHTLRRYAVDCPHLPGSGGELARHLLTQFRLDGVGLELTDQGDHYDPVTRCVRLTAPHMQGRSLSAVAVAAHEVGHALQHADGYAPLLWRTRTVTWAHGLERAGVAFMLLAPPLALLLRAPLPGVAIAGLGLCLLGLPLLVHLLTLPVEWDASFGRALPLLRAGDYLGQPDLQRVQQILLACALTYVAASLAGLLNLARWWRLWRR